MPSSKKRTALAKKIGSSASKKSSYAYKKTIKPQVATQYVLPLGNGWVVKSSQGARFIAITDSKKEAISIARTIARTKKTELIVHGKAGKIEVKESYAV